MYTYARIDVNIIFVLLYFQAYRATQCEKFTTSALVDNRRVKFTIWDTSGNTSQLNPRTTYKLNTIRLFNYCDIAIK